MKYILICAVALLVCFGLGFLFAKILTRKSTKPKKGKKIFLLTILFGILVMLLTTLGYMSIYYHSDKDVTEAMSRNEIVKTQKIDGGYFFDGPGTDKALIFYPGAKVECKAYSNLMMKLAENGIDCFLADMPFNFAMFGQNSADKFTENYSYETWIMSGHSMGGLVASNYSNEHSDKIDGLVLFASYPTSKLNNGIQLLSIYGTEDGCLNIKEYENDKVNWSGNAKEFVIEGGNHAQFGNYGAQKGDGIATITADEQQDLSVKAISDLWK